MSNSMIGAGIRVTAAVLVLGGLLARPASGQEVAARAPEQGTLPPAEELVARHVDVSNVGELLTRGAVRTVSEFSMASLGMKGDIVLAGSAPNRMVMRMALPGLGEIASGFDGTTAWSMNPMEGPRLMTGDELLQIRDEADFGANIRSAELVESMETVERFEMGGKACWKVRLLWKSGRETFDCYDVETGLLVGTQLETQTVMGSVSSTITFDDYTDFDGVMMPRTSRQQAFGQEMIVTLKTVEYGGIDPSVFDLPAEIRALVGK
jgi:hypothetical protein